MTEGGPAKDRAESATVQDVSDLDDDAFCVRDQAAAKVVSNLPLVVEIVVNACRAFVPPMLKQRHGSIVLIGSVMGQRGQAAVCTGQDGA